MKRLPYLRKMKVVLALLEKFHFSEHLKISEFREGGEVVSRAQLFSRIIRWRDLPLRENFRLAIFDLQRSRKFEFKDDRILQLANQII